MRHLTGIGDLSDSDIETILHRSSYVKNPGTVALMFHEPSTRTRVAFAQAAASFKLPTIYVDPATSSEVKGETVLDTCRNLAWAGVRVIVLRTKENGLPVRLAHHLHDLDIAVVNAGDGTNEHPTQALGDVRVIHAAFAGLNGIKVTIVGDVAHSRVARSNTILLSRLGCEVRLVCPLGSVGETPASLVTDRLKDGLDGAHVVMALRWQRERHGDSIEVDAGRFRLTEEIVASCAHKSAVVLHPGPVNRGVEITDDLVDGPRSLLWRQVAEGVQARANVLRMALDR